MFHTEEYKGSRADNYELLIRQLHALLDGESDSIANLSNASSLLNQFLDTINWVGFYLYKGDELVLGPFQGLPACVRIPLSRGVCGKAASDKATVRVANVHEFPGHIACDAASQSEIVIPMIKNGELVGVLDIDSPVLERFDELDQQYLEKFVDALVSHL
ncbi:GAF domain-containing protein [Paenibacillus lignilyticus]|uniref:GAF domain-containing protein n=1 Tax=Paenibacillus lignilyticus TaxID=1172615 RepID=A0ABS5C953_9BACL|nr:GAF domain-containing protein [Paenibacillus lignilyticus]MBP3962511.1 GAF domain-containing protein [Paenibacillus lignilyticus]